MTHEMIVFLGQLFGDDIESYFSEKFDDSVNWTGFWEGTVRNGFKTFTNLWGPSQIILLSLVKVIAGSFKSQLIDYFRGHIVSWEAVGRFMLIRNK